jgi:hypothetical protein
LLWVFTAGAGFRLLFTSGLARERDPEQAVQVRPEQATPDFAERTVTSPATPATPATPAASATSSAPAAGSAPSPVVGISKREARRVARERFDPPTLARARNAPMPGLRELAEFAHPACGIIGLAFWLGYALVHNRALAWIAFGLAAVTACAGLAWFTANTRAARGRLDGEPGPSFSARLIVLHGGAAALTFTLAALTALTARG